jgi:hypothetical protein
LFATSFYRPRPNRWPTISPNPLISYESPQRRRNPWLLSFNPNPGDTRKVQPEGKFQAATGSFVLKGSNFFARPEPGANIEAAWNADKRVLEREHRQLRLAIEKLRGTPRWERLLPKLWGIAFHDIYHAGQIRLLRRLNTKK